MYFDGVFTAITDTLPAHSFAKMVTRVYHGRNMAAVEKIGK